MTKKSQQVEEAEKLEGAEEVAEEVEAKGGKEVVVRFEGDQTRTYSGKDAMKQAKEFVSKKPEQREIV